MGDSIKHDTGVAGVIYKSGLCHCLLLLGEPGDIDLNDFQ